MDETPLPHTVEDCLRDLTAGDTTARERILELCNERLRHLTQRMLRGFPSVKRWEDTDDVFQNAMLRLYKCLGEVTIESPREIMALAATQIHRELIDLCRISCLNGQRARVLFNADIGKFLFKNI